MLTDIRQSFRLLWKAKRLTATTLITLALCIGATTAIFSSVYSLMLKPLPYQDPEQIVELYTSATKAGLDRMPANVPFYMDYSANATSYESLTLWSFGFNLVGESDSVVRIPVARATAEIFSILRIQPVIGTFFTKDNNRPGNEKVVVITQSYWEQQFNERPDVLGSDIRIDDETYKIIGVAPRVFEAFDARIKFVAPLAWPAAAEDPQGRYGVGIQLFGRLKPGVAIGHADAEAKVMEQRYVDSGPAPLKQFVERSGMTMNVGGVQEQRVQPVRSTLLMLQGGVAFVLLIGCVNVANLLLVRSNARQSEMALRSALGAARSSIARQFLTESLLLTSMGALLGMGVAWGALRVTNSYLTEMLPQSLPATLDWRVLGFAIALTVVVGLLIGLIPMIHVLRINLAQVIQSSSRSASSSRGVRAMSGVLVIAQVAVALMLLTGAGLLIRSFAQALKVDTGLNAENVITARIALTREHRASPEAAFKIRERLVQTMREIPGVTSVALSFSTPFQGGLPINAFTLETDTLPPGSPQPGAFRVIVTPGYKDTLGLQMVEGRFYEEADVNPDGRQQFVVDESFARKFFPGRSAIGGRFSFGGRPDNPDDWPVIIGVVKDVPHNGVEEKSGNPIIYQLLTAGAPGGLTMFMKADRPMADVITALRDGVRAIDPKLPLFDVGTLEDAVGSSFDNRRAVMLLLGAFAALALFLSALGIYGVLAYDVSQRTREIGVRSAIGASRSQISTLILTQGLWKGGIGVVIGLAGAWALSSSMSSLLFEVQPTEPIVYVSVSLVLIAVALLASYLPARRASRINPLVALRDE
ncbi:MAG: ABC transporter permease [Acidobacteria bacterium]|jgi:putative ABC transport system permease protein|nr:ABC transporter permease [Acidobacteriota bacterium]